MTSEEKKAIWNRLTDEEKAEAEEKKRKIIESAVEQERAAVEKLKSEGRWKPGLDGDNIPPELKHISDEYKCRLNALLEEYGLEAIDFK